MLLKSTSRVTSGAENEKSPNFGTFTARPTLNCFAMYAPILAIIILCNFYKNKIIIL